MMIGGTFPLSEGSGKPYGVSRKGAGGVPGPLVREDRPNLGREIVSPRTRAPRRLLSARVPLRGTRSGPRGAGVPSPPGARRFLGVVSPVKGALARWPSASGRSGPLASRWFSAAGDMGVGEALSGNLPHGGMRGGSRGPELSGSATWATHPRRHQPLGRQLGAYTKIR